MDLEEVLLLDCFLSVEQIVPVFVRKTGARKEKLSPILGEKYDAKIFIISLCRYVYYRKRSETPIEGLDSISMESQQSVLLLFGYELAFVLWFVEL